jgi:hypothetical protein
MGRNETDRADVWTLLAGWVRGDYQSVPHPGPLPEGEGMRHNVENAYT